MTNPALDKSRCVPLTESSEVIVREPLTMYRYGLLTKLIERDRDREY